MSNHTPDFVLIPMTRGYSAIVDIADGDLAECRWHSTFSHGENIYASRSKRKNVAGFTQFLHRVIMERILSAPIPPGYQVDHIDRDSLNNRRANLRLVTPAENARNRSIPKNNKSGVQGVHWSKDVDKWCASIRVDGKLITLGFYVDIQEAARIRREAECKYWGESGRPLRPEGAVVRAEPLPPEKGVVMTETDKEHIRQRIRSGESQREIAREWGVFPSVICKIYRNGVYQQDAVRPRNLQIAELYSSGERVSVLSEQFKLCHQQIRNILIKQGIYHRNAN